jgi:glycosyltransferase involved in cell wall biosynthesis
LLNRSRYRALDGFITCYDGAARDIHRWAPRARVEVVANVCPAASAPGSGRTEVRTQLGLKDTDCVVILVGRIQFRQKRQDFVIEHLGRIFGGADHAVLVIVGDGPDMPALRERVEASPLAGRIVLTGWRDDVARVLQAADVLLLPSRFEGMPLVMLEALAMGVPVVGSAVDGMHEMLPSEWLFPPDSVGDIRVALEQALAQGSEHTTALRARCAAMSPATFVEAFLKAMRRLMRLDGGEPDAAGQARTVRT